MRIVCRVAPGMMTSVIEGIRDNRFCVVNGDVCEPIECVDVPPGGDMERAQRRANELAVSEHARTGSVHKVVVSADL